MATSDHQVSFAEPPTWKSHKLANTVVGESIETTVGPVEGLVARQIVEHTARPLAESTLEVREVGGTPLDGTTLRCWMGLGGPCG